MTYGDQISAEQPVKKWDPVVRMTHWAIALAIVLNGIFTEEGSIIHVWVGYGAFAFLLLRLMWGVLGPFEARFSAFPPSLVRAKAHIKDIQSGQLRHYRSHNPLGSLMVYALWGCLAIVSITGIAMVGSPLTYQPSEEADEHASLIQNNAVPALYPVDTAMPQYSLVDWDGDEEGEHEGEGGELLEEMHEIAANLLFFLAALHIAGVIFETRRGERGLVRAIVTGKSKVDTTNKS